MNPQHWLEEFGLNAVEAEVYLALLRADEPQTAYAVAKAVGRPTANVYKAIDALLGLGAILIGSGKPRLCRPVPPEEFLRHRSDRLRRRAEQAAHALRGITGPPDDGEAYHITAPDAVIERARTMLAEAQTVLVFDAFPACADVLANDVAAAAHRGVRCFVQLYRDIPALAAAAGGVGDRMSLVVATEAERVLPHWRSEQLNLVVDGRAALVALMSENLGEVYQALYTRSLYLACLLHVGFAREHLYHRLARAGDDIEEIRRLLAEQPRFHAVEVPGQAELFRRLGLQSRQQDLRA